MLTYFFYFYILFIGIFYTVYSFLNVYRWNKLKDYNYENQDNKIFFSIIISIRNEAENIENCIASILKQNYPTSSFEIIIVDDYSSDNSIDLIKNFKSENIHVLHLSDYISADYKGGFKKKAIEFGIKNSKGSWIITTDGDVVAEKSWLATINSYIYQNNSKMISGPVLFMNPKSIFERFQCLDFAGMMLITGAGYTYSNPFLCNGANLAFEKSAFYELGGYDGNENIPSGDDLFLLEKIKTKFPNQVHFLKTTSALIYTFPKTTTSSYIHQRLRWGTKTTKLKDKSILFTLGLIWLNCFNICLGVIIFPFISLNFFILILIVWVLKLVADNFLLSRSTKFWKVESFMKTFLFSELYHTFFTAFIGLLGIFSKKTDWKSREINLN